jgi:glutamine synthetase
MTLDELRSAGITRVRVHYMDLVGTTRAKTVPLELLESAASHGLEFCVAVFAINHAGVMPDGTGLRDEVNLRDMQVVADVSTVRVLPWERDTAICLADCFLDGEPLPADPRGILRRAIAEAEAAGLRISCGHELEFFLLRLTPEGGFERYNTVPGEVYRMDCRVDPEGVVREIEDAVRGLGLPFLCVNQEYDASQWEINCRYAEALQAADDAHLLKLAVKEVAAKHGLVATFMGRPINDIGTSGYHLHVSAIRLDGSNAFEDPAGELGISDTARQFVGGLLAHGRGASAVLAPTVNAYKRLAAQELAPFFVDWGPDNRAVYVRVPAARGAGTRLECRAADGAANPYLVSAAAIFAGLDGVARSLDPGPPTDAMYDPGHTARDVLPMSLGEALDAYEADGLLPEKLGAQFTQAFVAIKRDEFRRFSLAVTDWELREYVRAL